MNNVKIKSLSFQGRRETNQDSFLEINPDNENFVFLAVADGMGGVAGGEKASHTVIDCCKKIITGQFKEDQTPDLKQTLRKIFFEAQRKIKEEIQNDPELKGMGTTLACVLILGDKFVWGNLGDSRIYYFTDSKLKLITKDHTHIQEFIDENKAPLTQSMIDNYGNFLTRSIDGGTDEPDIFPEDSEYKILKNGEAFLLCSDGLIDNKAEDNTSFIEKFITGTKDLEDAAVRLKDMAFENGSTDNITVVLLEKGKIKRKKISNLGKQVIPVKKIQTKSISKNHYNKISTLLGSLVTIVALSIFFLFFNKTETNLTIIPQSVRSDGSNDKSNKNVNDNAVLENNDEKDSLKQVEESKDKVTLVDNVKNKSEKDELKIEVKKDLLIEIPNIVGLPFGSAKAKLMKLGFECVRVDVKGPQKEIVLKQIPKSGSKREKNSIIKIIVQN